LIYYNSIAQEEVTPYEFFVHDKEVKGPLCGVLAQIQEHNSEKVLEILYLPQAKFRVQAVTRCSSSIPGEFIINGNISTVLYIHIMLSVGDLEFHGYLSFNNHTNVTTVDYLYSELNTLFLLGVWTVKMD